MQLTDIERHLLRYLQADPDISVAELADRVGASSAIVSRRVAALRARGVIRRIGMRIDWKALGYDVEVSLRVTLDKSEPNAFDLFTEAARQVPEVLEIQSFLGKVDVRLRIIARDMQHWHHLYRTQILALPCIADMEALTQVATLKSAGGLPI